MEKLFSLKNTMTFIRKYNYTMCGLMVSYEQELYIMIINNLQAS